MSRSEEDIPTGEEGKERRRRAAELQELRDYARLMSDEAALAEKAYQEAKDAVNRGAPIPEHALAVARRATPAPPASAVISTGNARIVVSMPRNVPEAMTWGLTEEIAHLAQEFATACTQPVHTYGRPITQSPAIHKSPAPKCQPWAQASAPKRNPLERDMKGELVEHGRGPAHISNVRISL